jgi:hypothetical protein
VTSKSVILSSQLACGKLRDKRPSSPPQENTCPINLLGLSHSIARWHVTNDGTQREQPPNSEVMQKMVVVAPHYTRSRTLDGEAEAEG